MSGWLLDTNVLSELRKGGKCDPGLSQWFGDVAEDELFISALVLGEIRRAIERIRRPDPGQARALEKWLREVATEFADRVLPVDEKVADQWGRLGLPQPVPILDDLLAATAIIHGLTVVSRDGKGFRNTGARLLNPFSAVRPEGH